jgi:hypothetical protein
MGAVKPAVSLAPVGPGIPSAPVQADQARLAELNKGSGIEQLQKGVGPFQSAHPVLGGILRGADALGTIAAPRIMQAIPGTDLHHEMLVGRALKQYGADTEADEREARATEAGAPAQELLTPKPGKEQKTEPLFGKNGDLAGFRDEGNSLIGADSPNLTAEMKDIVAAANGKPLHALAPLALWRQRNPDAPLRDWFEHPGQDKRDAAAGK